MRLLHLIGPTGAAAAAAAQAVAAANDCGFFVRGLSLTKMKGKKMTPYERLMMLESNVIVNDNSEQQSQEPKIQGLKNVASKSTIASLVNTPKSGNCIEKIENEEEDEQEETQRQPNGLLHSHSLDFFDELGVDSFDFDSSDSINMVNFINKPVDLKVKYKDYYKPKAKKQKRPPANTDSELAWDLLEELSLSSGIRKKGWSKEDVTFAEFQQKKAALPQLLKLAFPKLDVKMLLRRSPVVKPLSVDNQIKIGKPACYKQLIVDQESIHTRKGKHDLFLREMLDKDNNGALSDLQQEVLRLYLSVRSMRQKFQGLRASLQLQLQLQLQSQSKGLLVKQELEATDSISRENVTTDANIFVEMDKVERIKSRMAMQSKLTK